MQPFAFSIDIRLPPELEAFVAASGEALYIRLLGLLCLGLLSAYLLFNRNRGARITGLAILASACLWLISHANQTKPAKPDPKPSPIRPVRPKRNDDFPKPPAVGSNAPDGEEPQIDYPADQWFANIGSRINGAGMCVFTSFEMMCRWAGLEEFRGFRDWCAQRYPGGGYPSKLAALVKAYCKAKAIPLDRFDPDKDLIQYEGPSTEGLETALKTGRMPCVTLYRSPRYGSGVIYHMVCAVNLDQKWGCINDNNRMNKDPIPAYEWQPRERMIAALKSPQAGKLWYATIRQPGPPPPPKN